MTILDAPAVSLSPRAEPRASAAAVSGSTVALVMEFDPELGATYGIFSTYEKACEWSGTRPNPCVVVAQMVVDVPEFGNQEGPKQ